MKELQNILAQVGELETSGAQGVLATVVDVRGSSYRLPGAKMLILESGETFGTVSGGCLEADVMERAKQVVQLGKPQILTYDTTVNDDSIFALNMGCRGVVRILLEPASGNEYFDFVRQCFETRRNGVAITAIGTTMENLEIGARIFVDEKGADGQGLRTELKEFLLAKARALQANGRSDCETYETANGTAEFFFEIIKPPLALVVYGAGADAIPLVKLGKNLGWRVSVVDHRAAYATTERFPEADEILISRSENAAVEPNAVAVVMTHNFEHDKRILKSLLKSSAQYIGILGPKRRTESLLHEIAETGENFSASELEKLFAPVGLDLGADTPESIALSIVAEIQAVLNERAAGFLRNREGSIYNRHNF